jgi:hypothetical protein
MPQSTMLQHVPLNFKYKFNILIPAIKYIFTHTCMHVHICRDMFQLNSGLMKRSLLGSAKADRFLQTRTLNITRSSIQHAVWQVAVSIGAIPQVIYEKLVVTVSQSVFIGWNSKPVSTCWTELQAQSICWTELQVNIN